jgi:hypothetical protein
MTLDVLDLVNQVVSLSLEDILLLGKVQILLFDHPCLRMQLFKLLVQLLAQMILIGFL